VHPTALLYTARVAGGTPGRLIDAQSKRIQSDHFLKDDLIRLQVAPVTIFRGANRGANDHSYRATPGHVQPLSLQRNGTSGYIRRRQAAFRECLPSSRFRVRVAVGAQMAQVDIDIRNYDCSIEVLLAGNHSI